MTNPYAHIGKYKREPRLIEWESLVPVLITRKGRKITKSKSLKAVWRYAYAQHTEVAKCALIPLPCGYGLMLVNWADGSECKIEFDSYANLCEFAESRISWPKCGFSYLAKLNKTPNKTIATLP